MIGSFDYNNNDVMEILNNPNLNDEQKKKLFEKYKFDLKETRRKEIITRLNECAKSNPIITQEEYVNFLKKYNDDDLSKPFEVIESELEDFSRKMQEKYNAYLRRKEQEKAEKQMPVQEAVFNEPEEIEEPVNYEEEQDDIDDVYNSKNSQIKKSVKKSVVSKLDDEKSNSSDE